MPTDSRAPARWIGQALREHTVYATRVNC
jgi:hypothetical protein